MLSFILLVELCLLSQSGSTESPNPAALNQIRLPPTYSFSGTFEVTLQPTATPASPSCATITPGDVKGPFHIKPAGAGCAVLGSSNDATVDIWQADPAG
eukprot:gene15339-23815_t